MCGTRCVASPILGMVGAPSPALREKEKEDTMSHAPKFWAAKLSAERRAEFWNLVGFGFSGETAYCRLSLKATIILLCSSSVLGLFEQVSRWVV